MRLLVILNYTVKGNTYVTGTVERRLSERQSYETSNIRTHIFFVKIFSAFLFLKKNTVCSERVTKPAEIARQTTKPLLKEVEILQAALWYNA